MKQVGHSYRSWSGSGVGVILTKTVQIMDTAKEKQMRGKVYDADFYRGEVERLSLYLTQPITEGTRISYQRQLDSAKDRLAELESK